MKTLLLIPLLALTACASNDYALYADTAAKTEIARYNADAAKYKAMSDIAVSGTEAAKVAAVMAMTLGQGNTPQTSGLRAPQASEALQWASVLVPGLTQVAGIAANARVAQVQSNNAVRMAESTNSTFTGIAHIAGRVQAPNVSSVSHITTSNTTTSDRHDAVTTTLSGTGTLGSGAYSTAANPISTSDRHDVYTPAPVVVTPVVQVVPTVITPVVPVTPIINPVVQVTPTVITPVVQVVPSVITPVVPIVPVFSPPTVAIP